jgi:CAAX protease family protein
LKRVPLIVAGVLYGALLLALWFGFRDSALAGRIGSNLPRAFASFALLLSPLWFFGFGAAERLKKLPGWAKIACASILALPYFAFALGTPVFQWRVVVSVIALPVLLAAFLEVSGLHAGLTWRDVAVLAIIAAAYFLKLLQSAWPSPALAVLPKLFLADIVIYCFLVVREIDGAGYSLLPTRSAVKVGLREWAFYVPIAAALGELTGFIHLHAAVLAPKMLIAGILFTFLLVALPEELFFRAILQNLLETRFGKNVALLVAAILFGLSHFKHGSSFAWRYILLASIAGIFYGRAWRANRQILASMITHTAVDVVWSLWFR